MVDFLQTLKEMSTGVSKLNEQAQALKSAILKLTKEKVSVPPPSTSLLRYPSVCTASPSPSQESSNGTCVVIVNVNSGHKIL